MTTPEETQTRVQDQKLWHSPLIFITAGIALLSAFCWGLFWETERIIPLNPLGTELLRDYLGLICFSLLSLFFVLVASVLLYRGFYGSHWDELDQQIFYLGLDLGAVYWMTGFEYLFRMEWQYRNPIPFFLVKCLFIGLMVVFFLRVMRLQFRALRTTNSNPTPHSDG